MDRETGRSRGFAFITFATSEDASSAIQALDGQVYLLSVLTFKNVIRRDISHWKQACC